MVRRARRLSTLLFVSVLAGSVATSAQGPSDVAVISLEKYGWRSPPPGSPSEPTAPGQVLAVDHQGRVLVGYTAREREGLATRDNPSLAFHILRFTLDGTRDLDISVPTRRWFGNAFYLDNQDHILAWTNDTLQTLVTDEKEHAPNRITSTVATCSVKCGILQSPSRRTLLLWEIPGFGKQVKYVDTASSSPSVIQHCEHVSPYYPATITDRFNYSARQESRGDAAISRWPFCDYGKVRETQTESTGAIHALNDELFILVYHEALAVVSKDGRKKFLWLMSKNDVPLNEVSSDESGERFAAQIVSYHGGSTALDVGGQLVARRISIYDTNNGQQLVSIPAKLKPDSVFSFYVSPDGHELAVLEDGTLTVRHIE